jgi:hypothetical protein
VGKGESVSVGEGVTLTVREGVAVKGMTIVTCTVREAIIGAGDSIRSGDGLPGLDKPEQVTRKKAITQRMGILRLITVSPHKGYIIAFWLKIALSPGSYQ